MKEKIKTICWRILKVFAWILFSFSIFAFFMTVYDLFQGVEYQMNELIIFLIIPLGLAIGLGYIFRNTLLVPFRTFARLTFERKMILIVVIAIVISAGFYCWSVLNTIRRW